MVFDIKERVDPYPTSPSFATHTHTCTRRYTQTHTSHTTLPRPLLLSRQEKQLCIMFTAQNTGTQFPVCLDLSHCAKGSLRLEIQLQTFCLWTDLGSDSDRGQSPDRNQGQDSACDVQQLPDPLTIQASEVLRFTQYWEA